MYMLSKFNCDLFVSFPFDTIHIGWIGEGAWFMIETQSENSLSNAPEMT